MQPALASTMVVSWAEVTDSISNIGISEAQWEVEQPPSEPILPPQPSGKYDVDESVRTCEVVSSHFAWMILTNVSFSCPWNKNHTCTKLWHVTLGQDREDYCQVALRRREKLLPQG